MKEKKFCAHSPTAWISDFQEAPRDAALQPDPNVVATWKQEGAWRKSANTVQLPRIGEGVRLTSPFGISSIRQQPHWYSCPRNVYSSSSQGEGHRKEGQMLAREDRAVGLMDAAPHLSLLYGQGQCGKMDSFANANTSCQRGQGINFTFEERGGTACCQAH